MKAILLLLTLAVILVTIILSYQNFIKADYYASALLTATWFISLSLWIHGVSSGKPSVSH